MSWWEGARHRPRTDWKNLHLPFIPGGGSCEVYGVILGGEKSQSNYTTISMKIIIYQMQHNTNIAIKLMHSPYKRGV